jgi:ribonucleotide monophosphatase NagD (HAD superfamily)
MGHASGMDSALVFTGKTSPEMLQAADFALHPTYALNNVREVFALQEGNLIQCRNTK